MKAIYTISTKINRIDWENDKQKLHKNRFGDSETTFTKWK